MSKKKKWWQKGSWAGAEKDPSLFGNTIAKHSKQLKEKGLLDEDGFEILPEDSDDYGYSSRNWNWDQKLLDNKEPETKAKKYELTTSDYNQSYKTYEKTGYWGGYYKAPQLSYKYVQQMANALSAQHNIKVQVGNNWNVDLLKKTLTYNPASLIYGTKSELLATLMHEIGKLRYVTHSSILANKYLTMYKQPAQEVLSIYEDLRTDHLMLKAYSGAAEIYESIVPIIEKQVAGYISYAENFRKLTKAVPRQVLQDILARGNPNDPVIQQYLRRIYGTPDLKEIEQGLDRLDEELEKNGNIYNYCGEMLSIMYDLDDQKHPQFANIQEKVQKTLDTIEPSKKTTDSQNLVDYLDITTYPIVEDLLKDAKEKSQAIQNAFPKMSEQQNKEMLQQIMQYMEMQGKGKGVNIDANGNMKTRNSGQTDSTIPPEWENGDYRVLKDSVSMEIRQLINRLTFIRREELTVRYQHDQKRGKLNSRKLYKASTGSRRLFKKKLENTDTIQSFAFSILLDVSGSMNGARITHCTRALIILAEVFKKMNIPFEIITFDDGAQHVKTFEQDINKEMERKIGGIVKHSGGGTNLRYALDAVKVQKQPQKNKIVIVLTDGGVGRVQEFDTKYFIPWQKQGVKSVGFGVECEDEMKELCQGNSKLLDNASQLPVEFSTLLKNLIKR